MLDFEYEYDKIVIGGNLKSLMTAYHEGFPIIWKETQKPFFWHEFNNGLKKKHIWESMAFYLSLSGLAFMADRVEDYFVDEEEKILTIYPNEPYLIKVKFNEIINLETPLDIVDKKYEMIDHFRIRSIGKHDIEEILCPDKEGFVDRIIFHSFHPQPQLKDLVSISYMSRSESLAPEHDENIARLKTLQMMEDAGIVGRKNGNFYGKPRRVKIKIEFSDRQFFYIDNEAEQKLFDKYANVSSKNEDIVKYVATIGDPYGGG